MSTGAADRAADGLGASIDAELAAGIAEGRFSAAACCVAVAGRTVYEAYRGTLAAYGPDGRPLPDDQRQPTDAATLFDLASLTKLFTAHTALTLVDEGRMMLDGPLADVLPAYRDGDRRGVTLRHLLTHTSGLPAEWRGWRTPLATWLAQHPDSGRLQASPLGRQRAELLCSLLDTPLAAAPGRRFEYSDVGYNVVMGYAEAVTGTPWSQQVAEHTLGPLGLAHVTFAPDPTRAAATEYEPQYRRGVVRGTVHDETAWSLGADRAGAGNAGLFAPAVDLLAFAEAIRLGEGRVRGRWMWDDALTGTLGQPTTDRGFGSAMGLRIADAAFQGRSSKARGHTGFTGTSVHIDRDRRLTVVLLTNRVHPRRDGASMQPLRARIADLAADAVDAGLAGVDGVGETRR